ALRERDVAGHENDEREPQQEGIPQPPAESQIAFDRGPTQTPRLDHRFAVHSVSPCPRDETQSRLPRTRNNRARSSAHEVREGPGTDDLSEDRSLCRRLRGAQALYPRSTEAVPGLFSGHRRSEPDPTQVTSRESCRPA